MKLLFLGGVIVSRALNASATVLYVDLNSSNPTPPYTNWSTAATNIQDAVDVALDNDRVLVTNGVYQYGGWAVSGQQTNRVVLSKAIELLSVNGPGVTTITGETATRCAYVGSLAFLEGFTLTGGRATNTYGGGTWCEVGGVVSNCVIISNIASLYGGEVTEARFTIALWHLTEVLGAGRPGRLSIIAWLSATQPPMVAVYMKALCIIAV